MNKPLFYPSRTTPLALATLSLAVAVALAVSGNAHASAFQLKEDSAKALGRAYAGKLTAGNDVSVVADSPASMSDLKGTYLQFDMTAINFSAKFKGSVKDAQGIPISGNNGGNAGTTMPVPSLFYATQLTDRWHVGAALTVPFGFQTKYQKGWVGRYNALKSKFQSLDATLSASYALTDNFSVGASAIAQKTSVELSSAINANAAALKLVKQLRPKVIKIPIFGPDIYKMILEQTNVAVPRGTEGSVLLKGDDWWGWGWQLGTYWKVSPNDRLAFNYRSKIKHKIRGRARFMMPKNVFTAMDTLKKMGYLPSDYLPFQDTYGTANFTTPAVASASYWHQADSYGVGVDLAWTQWSVFKTLSVKYDNPSQPETKEVHNWRNTFYASVGGEYYLSDSLTLRGGFGFDQTPTYLKTRDPRVPDFTARWYQ